MDTLQLVEGKSVRLYTLKRGISDTIIYDEDAVLARYGFLPKLYPTTKDSLVILQIILLGLMVLEKNSNLADHAVWSTRNYLRN